MKGFSGTGMPQRYGLSAWIVNAALIFGISVLLPAAPAWAETKRIVVLGDSLTAGLGLDARDAFPAKLEAALKKEGHDVRVIGAGVSGDTTAGGRTRLAWALSSAGANGPDGVIVELGANDGLRALDPKATQANLAAILTELKNRKIPTLLTGMRAPPNLGAQYEVQFNTIFPLLAVQHDVIFYPFFLDGVAAVPALNQNDAIHPNAKGVEEIVRRIVPYVLKLLDKPKS